MLDPMAGRTGMPPAGCPWRHGPRHGIGAASSSRLSTWISADGGANVSSGSDCRP